MSVIALIAIVLVGVVVTLVVTTALAVAFMWVIDRFFW